MASPASINALLEESVRLLNEAGQEIRELPLNPLSKNILHIGRAASEIFEIQYQLWALHPDVGPAYARQPSHDPEEALDWTLEHSRAFEAAGDRGSALAFLRQFLARETDAEGRAVVEEEMRALEGRDA